MNSYPKWLLIVVTVILGFAPWARADEASYAAVIKEREQVLTQILAEQEALSRTGVAKPDELDAARLALYSFRRDTAPGVAAQIEQQALIVGVFEKKLELVLSLKVAGVVGSREVLNAKAALLEARQRLEELRLKGASR